MMLLLGYGDGTAAWAQVRRLVRVGPVRRRSGALHSGAAHPAGRVRVWAERGRPGQPWGDAIGGQAGARDVVAFTTPVSDPTVSRGRLFFQLPAAANRA